MYELIITEKPNAALKIAAALADGKPLKKTEKGVSYFEVTHKGKDLVVVGAVGHLYGLAQKEGTKGKFPVFDIEWTESNKVRKEAKFSKKYLDLIKKVAKKANEFTVATDYDIEGEVIGLNVIKYACKQKDAKRMKFSTLTKPDLVKAYENASPTLDWGQAKAGETRHMLDWYNGINYSRALTAAMKSAGNFKIMSTGRVQGPALKIVVDREKEILAFEPTPYWQIELKGKVKQGIITAMHEKDKFWEKKEADQIMEKTKGQPAKVDSVEKKSFKQAPPNPFDLTSLQIESYRCLRISPKETLAMAQELYTGGFISYPRTSSQQLPPEIGFKKILSDLAKQECYKELADSIASKKELNPNNGKKTDPAHPAIYPTGTSPNLDGKEAKLYDLIVRRFFATFGDPATRETMNIKVNCSDEIFIAKGTRTTEKGWHVFYQPYLKLDEEELPAVSKEDEVKVKSITELDKETQPPKRYTPASIIKELEKKGLGTKATRASILDTLYNRGYIADKNIKATDIGIKTIETLGKYAPKIIDEVLTNHFENEMEKIREDKKTPEEVLNEAKEVLTSIITVFKEKEKEIGSELIKAYRETETKENKLGPCPTCKDGTLMMRRGKFGRFIACDKYPDCKTTFKLPANGLVKNTDKVCEECSLPQVLIIRKAKKPQELCINPDCKTKQVENSEAKKVENGEIEKICPKCSKKLVLRKSIYGQFYGCSSYPKCRHTEKIAEEK